MTVVLEDEDFVVVKPSDDRVRVEVADAGTQGPAGPAGAAGPPGPPGERGSQVLSGPDDPSPVIGLVGDQYLNTTTGTIFGPKTESGWGTGVVLGSGLTLADVAYTHYQTIIDSVWTINHTLGFSPNIIVVDLSGNDIHGDYQYSGNTVIATFSEAIAGAAYLS